MAFLENILIPLITAIFYVFMIIAIGILIYKGIIKGYLPKLKLFVKYSILKKEPKEQDVEWCLDAYEKNKSETEIRKILLTKSKNISKDRVEEILYIYRKIIKMKGGLIQNEQYREIGIKIE